MTHNTGTAQEMIDLLYDDEALERAIANSERNQLKSKMEGWDHEMEIQ